MKTFKYIFTRVLCAVAVALTFWFIDTYCVDALQNIGPYSDLTISEKGIFYDNSSNTSFSNRGYKVEQTSLTYDNPFYYALPTTNLTLAYNGYGGSLSQCGLSFIANNYYSMSFVFKSLDGSYIHPSYTQKNNKLGISNEPTGSTSFNYNTQSVSVEKLSETYYGGEDGIYTIIFKAPQDGTCITTSFSSNPTGYLKTVPSNLMFLGYKYSSMGSKAPSTEEIQSALQGQFNSINSKIDSSINSVNSNIDSMKDKQDETNSKLDEQHETSKGIWGSLKDGISSIGSWFSNLANSIGDFFGNLISALGEGLTGLFNGIKSLFFGEETEECTQYVNFFNGYQKYAVVGTQNKEVKPTLDTGWFDLFSPGKQPYYASNIIPALKTDTKYTFIIETGDISVNNMSLYPNTVNTFFTPTQFAGNYSGFTLESNSRYFATYTTVSDFTGINYAYVSSLSGSGGTIKNIRIILLEGEWNESNFNLEYFQGTKDVCTSTGSTGGLFGILGNFFKSVGEFFGKLFGFIEDDSIDSDSASNFFSNFGDTDHGGISSIVTAPLVFVRKLTSSCDPLTIPFYDNDIVLPCGDTLFWNKPEVSNFRNTWNLIFGGVFIFFLLSKVFKVIENIKDPESDKVEVMKL